MTLDVPRLLAVRGDLPRADLVALGVTETRLQDLIRRGVIVRVGRATYGVPRPHLSPEEAHQRLAAATLRRYEGRAVLSHHSALAAAGLPLHGVPLGVAHVTSLRGARYRRRTDHVLHAADVSTRPPSDSPERVGTGLDGRVHVAHALVQTGLRWGAEALLPSADQAMHRGLVTRQELQAAVTDYAHSPGMSEVRPAVAAVDHLAESVGESLLRWRVLQLGYPVRSQVDPGCRGHNYRVDLVIDGYRVALEFDGMDKYALRPGEDEAVRRARIRAERARDEDIRTAGWYVIHFTWPEIFRPAVIAARIEAAIAWLTRAA
ncbi:MAG: hypothetical protein LCH98_02530 [Actinobacteria bacterium]|nr:hypothetical protein [Actinomycetota bacterium]